MAESAGFEPAMPRTVSKWDVAWAVLETAALTILPTLRDVMAGAASAFSGKATPRRREGNLALPPTGQMVGLLGFEPRINRL